MPRLVLGRDGEWTGWNAEKVQVQYRYEHRHVIRTRGQVDGSEHVKTTAQVVHMN